MTLGHCDSSPVELKDTTKFEFKFKLQEICRLNIFESSRLREKAIDFFRSQDILSLKALFPRHNFAENCNKREDL